MSATRKINCLAFSGGGAAGIAFAGAVEELNKTPGFSFADIKAVSGTSVGAIAALMVSLNYSQEEITASLATLNLKKFQDGGLLVNKLYGLFTRGGIHKGDAIIELISDFLKRKGFDENATFKDLHDRNCKDIYIVATKLYKVNDTPIGKQKIFCYEKTPDTRVLDAIRASCAAPIYFRRVRLKKVAKGKYVTNENGHMYVDGGIINNLPIDIFDGQILGNVILSGDISEFTNSHAMGIALIAGDSADKNTCPSIKVPILDHHPIDSGEAVVNTIFMKSERDNINHPKNRNRVIKINRGNVALGDFDMSDDKRATLIEHGRQGVREYFATSQTENPSLPHNSFTNSNNSAGMWKKKAIELQKLSNQQTHNNRRKSL